MARVHRNESAIRKATSIKPNRGEDRQAFLGRLVEAAADLDENAFSELPEESQAWYTAASTAWNAEEDLPEFGKAASITTQEEDTQEEEQPVATTKRKKKAGGKKAAATEKPKRTAKKTGKKASVRKAKPAETETRKRDGSAPAAQLLHYVVTNPEATRADADAFLEENGYELASATVASTYYGTRRVMQAASNAGLLKKKLPS